ncbi:MAG: Coenzyme F420 hydrogenase/dehydrogenase, beta subunit C-terminal domain [Clostridia bacterium]|nr:Coenzyme F420 hydrogenase/dehydrogenase, beta subunit C-terminal domain [Clostridia bacterium]
MNHVLKEQLNNRCTSCSVCFAVCPRNAIEFKLSENGFYRPFIQEDLCVNCGLCKTVCAKYDNDILEDNDANYSCIALKSTNKNILKNSSSGGACYEIAKLLLNEGYGIIGVTYDHEKKEAIGVYFDNIGEFEKIRGSKYFQSDISVTLRNALNSGKKYAIFATPCQIYGIRKSIEKLHVENNFILIDIFCHGTPTVLLWKKYIDYQQKNIHDKHINDILFRSKAKGWHRFCTTFVYEKKQKTSKIINDPFYTLFFGKDLFNEACYPCKFRSTLRYTDIRIGDFWGFRYDTDLEGVSCVVGASEVGTQILEKIDKASVLNRNIKFNEVTAAQSYGETHSLNNKRRNSLMESLLDSESDIKDTFKIYKKNLSFKEKLKLLKKNLIKAFPLKMSNFFKKIYHSKKYGDK